MSNSSNRSLIDFSGTEFETVARWPLSTDVCIFGNPSKYTKDRLDDFFSVIVINTILKFVLTYVGTVEQCPPGTRLYARFHSGETDVLETLKLDLAAIARIKEYKKPFSSSEDKSSSMNKYGYAKIVINHNTNIFAYAAVNQFDRNETIYDSFIANNATQQELFQIIVLSTDKEVVDRPVSIIEEPVLYVDEVEGATEGDVGVEPRYRKHLTETSPQNLCLYDIMLLLTLYGPGVDRYNPESKLGLYEDYISKHFNYLVDRAKKIMENPAYNELFMRKC